MERFDDAGARDIKERINVAARRWPLWYFCEKVGLSPTDSQAKQLFADFQQMAGLLDRFDAATLARILNAPSDVEIARRAAAAIDEFNSRGEGGEGPIN